jgi:predicted Zn-dependent protease
VLIRRTDLAWWIRRIQRTANGGRTEPAREMLAELRRWHPDAREVDFTEGVILVNERRLDDAVTLFGRLVEADPDWAAARIRAGATLLARADASADAIAAIDDRIAAEAMLVAALENEPDNADGLALLVAAREAMGRPADAVEPLRTLVERVPGERRHRYRLARALVAAGEPVEAVAVLDAAIEALGPEGPPATVLRVEALMAAGRADEAAAVVAGFRDRMPRHPAVSEMQRLIESGARP